MEKRTDKIKKNSIWEVEVVGMSNLGYGVARIHGMTIFIGGGVPKDRLEIKIIKVTSGYCVGKIEKVLAASEYRLGKDNCEVATKCGGCVFRNIQYSYELAVKKEYVESEFRKVGLTDITVEDVLSGKQIDRWRNKAQYPVSQELQAGFFATKSHRIIPCNDCLLQPKIFGEITRTITEFLKENDIDAYDEMTGKGMVRHIYLRRSSVTHQCMVCLVIHEDTLKNCDLFVKKLCNKFSEISCICLNINKENTNVIMGEKTVFLYGKHGIEDELLGKKFFIPPLSFYQVNHDVCEMLYQKAAELAAVTVEDTVLDLYCGIGSIGICAAANAKNLIGVEIVEEAVTIARENARMNGLQQAEFLCGDAGKAAEELEARGLKPTVVFLDPPRKGCGETLINTVVRMAPKRIVYISCNPATLARDVALFSKKGYLTGTAYPVDMFPRTSHVETVVLLERNNTNEKTQIQRPCHIHV